MSRSDQNKTHILKEKFITVGDWIMDHSKIVMPIVLIVCVLITVFFAVNANRREKLEKEAEMAAVAVAQEEASGAVEEEEEAAAPVYELEKNAYPEVNDIIRTYYDAQASGDIEVVSALNTYLNEIEKIRVEELSKYIESYPVLDVYTKPGLDENTYVAYVYSEVKFKDIEQELPGMQTYYIGQNENGEFFINDGTYDNSVWSYIKEVTLQDDVVDLNNKVVVEYNEFLAADEELNEFVAYLKEKINEEVGEILAKAEQPAEETQEATGEGTENGETGEAAEEEPQPQENADADVVQTVKATAVVNIRTSDSETADKIDKAQIGQEFRLLEQRGNGWSKVEYNGKDAFIKSDYLETVSETAADVEQADADESNAQEETSTQQNESLGTVSVIENVRVRKSASTESESLGTAYVGEKLELLMKQADGWTRVKYNGETGYVKSEYVK